MKNHFYRHTGLTLLIFIALAAGNAYADTSRDKRQSIVKLMEISGAADTGKLILKQITESLKPLVPGIEQKFWDEFTNEAAARIDELMEKVILIYDKYFTDEELKALIAFYESPIGKKLVSVTPQITQESMAIGQEWGLSVAKQAIEKLEKKGYKLK